MRAPIGDFDRAIPLPDALDLLVSPVAEAVRGWAGPVPAGDLLFVDSDPEKADTAVFVATYGEDLAEASANCVIVAGRRGGETTLAAAVVPSLTRVDVNGVVRRHLGVRKASFAPHETAVRETGMEYGGITPIGLPAGWPLLLDSSLVGMAHVLIGSGARRGKLIVPGAALAALPHAEVLDGLGR